MNSSKCWKNSFFIWIIVYLAGFDIISALLNKISFSETMFLAYYQMFVYLIPGMAILLLLRIYAATDTEWIGFLFVSGYCYNILLYYIVFLLGIQSYIRIVSAVFAALSIFVIYKKRHLIPYSQDRAGLKICTVGTACYVLFMFVSYNGNGLTPDLVGQTDYLTYHRDVLYWIGNLNSLIKQYPPINPREYTNGVYNYHYFSSLQLAVQSLVSGIDTVVTCIGQYFYSTVAMIIFGTYLLAKEILKSDKKLVLAMAALLITSGVENITKIEQVCHYALTSFGTDYGLGIMLFLLLALYRYSVEASGIRGAVCIFLLAVLTGTKGPYAAVAICGFGGMCLIWLLQKKAVRAFGIGGAALGVFGAVYYFVCNTRGYNGGSGSRKLLNLVIRTDPNMSMFEACLRKLGREILNVLLMKPVVLLPLIVILIIFFFRKKKMTVFEFACLCMTAAGLAVNAVITMPSNQQTYFALAALVPAWCLLLDAGKSMNMTETIGHTGSKWIKGAVTGLFLFGVVCFVGGYTYNGNRFNVVYSVADGMKMIGSRITGKEIKEERQKYIENGYTLGREDYEALQVIAQDNDQQAVILHILPEEKEGCRSYRLKLIGSFSTKYIMKDEMAAGKLMENSKGEYQRLYDMGVRYIVLDLWENQEITVSDEFTEEIYAGEQMKLFRIRAEKM